MPKQLWTDLVFCLREVPGIEERRDTLFERLQHLTMDRTSPVASIVANEVSHSPLKNSPDKQEEENIDLKERITDLL